MKKTCHIIGAGDFSPRLLDIKQGDIVIACDGGLAPLLSAGISVNYCIGDFDSLGKIPEGNFHLTVLPKEKDVTDTYAACSMAVDMGFDKLRLYGMLGGERFSHSVANLQLIASLAEKGCDAVIIDDRSTIYAIKNSTLTFAPDIQGFVSVFAFTPSAVCSCKGLKYNIENHSLTYLFPLGVSNELVGCMGEITIKDGIAIVVLEQKS